MDAIDVLLIQTRADMEKYRLIIKQYENLFEKAQNEYKNLYEIKKSKEIHPKEYGEFLKRMMKTYDDLGEELLNIDKPYYKRFKDAITKNKK